MYGCNFPDLTLMIDSVEDVKSSKWHLKFQPTRLLNNNYKTFNIFQPIINTKNY